MFQPLALACLQPWPVSRTHSPVISVYAGYELYCYWQNHQRRRQHTLIASHFLCSHSGSSTQLFSPFFLPITLYRPTMFPLTPTLKVHPLNTVLPFSETSHFPPGTNAAQPLKGLASQKKRNLPFCSLVSTASNCIRSHNQSATAAVN